MNVKIIKSVGLNEIQIILDGQYEEVLALLSEMGELEDNSSDDKPDDH